MEFLQQPPPPLNVGDMISSAELTPDEIALLTDISRMNAKYMALTAHADETTLRNRIAAAGAQLIANPSEETGNALRQAAMELAARETAGKAINDACHEGMRIQNRRADGVALRVLEATRQRIIDEAEKFRKAVASLRFGAESFQLGDFDARLQQTLNQHDGEVARVREYTGMEFLERHGIWVAEDLDDPDLDDDPDDLDVGQPEPSRKRK